MKVAWVTDPHLDMCTALQRGAFYRRLRDSKAGAVLVTGDISSSATCLSFIQAMRKAVKVPVYFVLGNHDFWGSDKQTMRMRAAEDEGYLSKRFAPHTVGTTALIGIDGWGDATNGPILEGCPDYTRIADFRGHEGASLLMKLQAFGKDEAASLAGALDSALRSNARVAVAMHVPPFRNSSLFEGKPTWRGAGTFTCRAVGDTLLGAAEAYPHCLIEVFCGHSHESTSYLPMPNLIVHTDEGVGPDYGPPKIRIITL